MNMTAAVGFRTFRRLTFFSCVWLLMVQPSPAPVYVLPDEKPKPKATPKAVVQSPKKPTPAPAPAPRYPYALQVPGKIGFVMSPYAPNKGYIDVRGFPHDTEVKDPYSGRSFLVP